jgi:hypothetical protein
MTVYKQILIDAKLRTGKSGQKDRGEWEKCIEEAKLMVRIGL